MKRNLLAIAIPALLVAGTASASIEVWNKDCNKVDLYGRVYALNYLTDRNNGLDGEGDKTTARLGIIGQTQISDDLIGYGRFEWETKTGNSEYSSIQTRYAFAGLNFGQYGAFDYGRNDGVLKTLTSYTDVLPEFGGDASNNDYYVLSGRTKAVATYRNDSLFGLNDDIHFALQYADNGDNSNTSDNVKTGSSKEAFGAVADWNIANSGFSIGAGYAQTSGGNKHARTWSVGIKYDNDNLYLAALYLNGKQDHNWNDELSSHNRLRIQGYEIVAQYGIDFEVGRLTPSIAYIQHSAKDADKYNAGVRGNYLAKYVDVGLTYDFNKNLQGLIDYKINLLDRDDAGPMLYRDGGTAKGSTKDTVAVGLIYQF